MEAVTIQDRRAEQPAEGQGSFSAEIAPGLKKCPFCAEQIQSEAIKCRFCGEFLDGSRPSRPRPRRKGWYFATPTVVLALLVLGPLALPLVWSNPRYKPMTKALITALVLVVTVACVYLLAVTYKLLLNQIQVLGM